MKKIYMVLLALLLVTSAAISPASADIWGVNPAATGNELININPFTGAIVNSYAIAGIGSTNTQIGLAGWNNELFYINGNVDAGTVKVINPATGAVTSTFSITGGWNVNGLGYWSGGGQSYLYTSGCSNSDVHRYVASNGSGPTYFWSNITGPVSVAGDNGGRIFAAGQATTVTGGTAFGIWELDPLNDANGTWFAASPTTDDIVGMAYDGTYLYISDDANKLYTMNNAGQLVNTLQMNFTLFALGSTEGVPSVPEPATILLLGCALAGLPLVRRRFR